jgi:hypothetical protein
MANTTSWGWYVASLWPNFDHRNQNNIGSNGNGLSIDPSGYTEMTLVDSDNDGVIYDRDDGDNTNTAPGENVVGPNVTLTPKEISLFTDSTIVMKGQVYTVDITVTLFTDGTYGARIMDYDIPGGHYKHVTSITLGTWNGVEYGGIYVSGVDEMFICFAAGTGIKTPDGWIPAEQLNVGDMVSTTDGREVEIRWTAKNAVSGEGRNAPILFRAKSMGNTREVLLSPHHRVLVGGSEVEFLFGVPEVLVAARDLVNGNSIFISPREKVEYVHFACDKHELIFADGMATETLLPGPQSMSNMTTENLRELLQAFPHLKSGWSKYGPAARMCLKHREASLLCHRSSTLYGSRGSDMIGETKTYG